MASSLDSEKENLMRTGGGSVAAVQVEGSKPKLLMNQLDNYIIVDVGANLTNKKFSRDLDSVIQRAKDSGVSKIMVTGTSIQSSRDALRLSRLYPGVLYATAGWYLYVLMPGFIFVRFEKKLRSEKNSGFSEKTLVFVNFRKTQVKNNDFRLVLLNTPTKKLRSNSEKLRF